MTENFQNSNFLIKKINQINTPKLILDYLNNKKELHKFYHLFPSHKNLIIQARLKLNSFNNRNLLLKIIKQQLEDNLDIIDPNQKINLYKLSKKNTATITCGHQLNILTGPIYFIYKILQTIKLSKELNQIQKEIYFVPIFWFATEDHDFLEINHFWFKKKKWVWEGINDQDVGKKSITNLLPILKKFIKEIKLFPKSEKIIFWIKNSYFKSKNLAEATYKLVNYIFSHYGLIGIDGNAPSCKKILEPIIKEELLNYRCFKEVSLSNQELLKLDYKIQVNPKKINLFKLNKNKRIYINDKYANFLIEEISPNVLIRTIYQELILPNTAYIGGNSEISYWLQLKKYFDYFDVLFPILIPRNSFTILTEKQFKKINKFNISYYDLLNDKSKTIKNILLQKSKISIDFKRNIKQIGHIYDSMIRESEKTEKSLKNLLLAQKIKQINQFKKIEKRIIKAEKNKQIEIVKSIEQLYEDFFPNGNDQERYINFFDVYLENTNLLDLIYKNISTIEPYSKILKI